MSRRCGKEGFFSDLYSQKRGVPDPSEIWACESAAFASASVAKLRPNPFCTNLAVLEVHSMDARQSDMKFASEMGSPPTSPPMPKVRISCFHNCCEEDDGTDIELRVTHAWVGC